MGLKQARETGRRIIEGAWVDVDPDAFPELAGVSFNVRGLRNPEYERLQAKLNAPLKKDPKTGLVLDPDETERVVDECLVEATVNDWRGLRETEGEPEIPFSKEKLREFLADKALRSVIRPAIIVAALRVRDLTAKSLESAEKN